MPVMEAVLYMQLKEKASYIVKNIPFYFRDFPLLRVYQVKKLFPDVQRNSALNIRLHILLKLIERGIFLDFFNSEEPQILILSSLTQ